MSEVEERINEIREQLRIQNVLRTNKVIHEGRALRALTRMCEALIETLDRTKLELNQESPSDVPFTNLWDEKSESSKCSWASRKYGTGERNGAYKTGWEDAEKYWSARLKVRETVTLTTQSPSDGSATQIEVMRNLQSVIDYYEGALDYMAGKPVWMGFAMRDFAAKVLAEGKKYHLAVTVTADGETPYERMIQTKSCTGCSAHPCQCLNMANDRIKELEAENARMKAELEQARCPHSYDVMGVCELCALGKGDGE